MEVKLENKKTVVIAPAVTKELEKVTIVRIVDLPVEKKVRAFVRELGRPIELPTLSDENYGDWNDKKVADAVKSELAKL
ncbi:MAG: hypothetical protein EBR40_09140 [Proteobacteria bacterium]|nr:hypothetical protein [Pseudomonadota bacterium]